MRVYIHKLGCPKNDVDADYIAARIAHDGHEIVATPDGADSVIVNTCGFIDSAKEESINEILRFGQHKRSGNIQTLYASGCLTQRYGDEMLAEIPELDGTFGHGALDSLARAVGEKAHLGKAVKMESRKLGYLSWKDRFISDRFPYSYIKISDGCDRTCTYCAIPGMRGKFRSRPIESILREAEFLSNNGKKELILVSQEATLYGYDLPGKPNILSLLKELEKIDAVSWIRLMYLYPAYLTQEVITYLTSGTKTLPYFDLPFQHASSNVLKRMNRMIDRAGQEKLIHEIRKASPTATLRTTFIVGFPGETEKDFVELADFVQENRFDRMGVFAYSAEEGTPAASMPDQVPDDEKRRRMDHIMAIQNEIAFEKAELLIGSEQDVLIDEVHADGTALGRTIADCPDIDQEITIVGQQVTVGDLIRVRVTSTEGFDLIGSALERVA